MFPVFRNSTRDVRMLGGSRNSATSSKKLKIGVALGGVGLSCCPRRS